MFYMSSISGYPFLFSFLLYTFADVLLFIPNQKCSHDCLLYSCVWGQLQQLCRSSVFMAWSLCLLWKYNWPLFIVCVIWCLNLFLYGWLDKNTKVTWCNIYMNKRSSKAYTTLFYLATWYGLTINSPFAYHSIIIFYILFHKM